MHISVKSKPLAIYFEGSRGSVRAVEKYVNDVRKVRCCICITVFEVYSLVSRALWRISLTHLLHILSPKNFFREFHAFPEPS